ncbi:MAG: hypothetical protein M1389_04185 [Chloroflexi bacterium]|nr:hypothetical protein [Chloroflexota bacterium]
MSTSVESLMEAWIASVERYEEFVAKHLFLGGSPPRPLTEEEHGELGRLAAEMDAASEAFRRAMGLGSRPG